MPKKPKILEITVLFNDTSELSDIFSRITQNVTSGKQHYSDQFRSCYYDMTFSFMPNYRYEEKVINGQICYTYKSKV